MRDNGEIEMQAHYPHPIKQRAKFKDVLTHQLKIFRFGNRTKIPLGMVLIAILTPMIGSGLPSILWTFRTCRTRNSGSPADKPSFS